MIDKLDLTKKVASIIIGAGTTRIVTGIIKNNTAPDKIQDKIAIASAGLVLGAMASDATKKYTDAKIDELAAWYKETRAEIKKKFASED